MSLLRLCWKLGMAGCVAAVALSSCEPPSNDPPTNIPAFPTGVAIAGDHLIVVSSNFDLNFERGAVLSAPVSVADNLTPDTSTLPSPYAHAAFLPSFGDRPVVTSGGERAYVPTREANRVNVIDIDSDGRFSCGDGAATPTCGEAPFALQLVENDPFAILITEEQRAPDGTLVRVEGITTLLSSRLVVFFSDDRSRAGAQMVQNDGSLDLGEGIGGVRSAVLRPEVAGTDPVVIAAVDLDRQTTFDGARLLLFEPSRDATLRSFDVTAATGALSLRDIELVAGEDGEHDALIAVLREPDGVARFEIDEDGALPALRLTGVAAICREPGALARTTSGGVERLLVTCREDDAVLAFDPATLVVTDAVRFAGREPYEIVVAERDAAGAPLAAPRAFVSFFLDNSVGVLDLLGPAPGSTDADAIPRVSFRGRLGEASPRPEDGRE